MSLVVPRRLRQRPEESLQRACVDLLTWCVPPPPEGPAWTAINPVSAKSRAVAGISKAMGLRAGIPDLLMLHEGRAVFVEFKAPRGRVSPEQKTVHAQIRAAGGQVSVARSLEEFIAILEGYGIADRLRERVR